MAIDTPAAVIGTFVKISTMADGTPRIVLDLDCTLTQAAALNLSPGTPIAIARIEQNVAQHHAQQETIKKADGWGHVYQSLYKSGWWHNPRVVKAYGIDPSMAPDKRIKETKRAIYDAFDIESLADLHPSHFVEHITDIGLADTLPVSVIEAAMGQPR